MKKLLVVVLSIFSLSMALPALAKQATDVGEKASLRQTRVNERGNGHKTFNGTGEDARTIAQQKREEARNTRIESRAEKFEKRYNKKTALMVKHFDRKLAVFEAHLKDEILLKVYPIFLNKLERFTKMIEDQDGDEMIKTERLNYLSALSSVISEELTNLQELVANSDENIEDSDENIETDHENIDNHDENDD